MTEVVSVPDGKVTGQRLIQLIAELHDAERFKDLHWEGSFEEYLDIVVRNPGVARTAFQRLYDMIMSYGVREYVENRETITHYNFFDDPIDDGADAVYGLDRYLMALVDAFHSAAQRYGTERRVLLLHGPVGSSKSTIVRLLKKGLEAYSRTDEGALYTFSWHTPEEQFDCPMHEEPLHLIPAEHRPRILAELNKDLPDDQKTIIEGDLCPACRFIYRRLLEQYGGDWTQVIKHVRVKRLILSEKDRIGIGTFQPKDEKNQDSTELTGDINYRKIAEYGSDSDPRSFNFDGEFNISNRGLVEFIEVLKLDVAFLYDLLGASQEHKIKPKKFAQTDIDEVILGHSVSGDTPIMYLAEGQLRFTTMARLYADYADRPEAIQVMSVNLVTGTVEWTAVRRILRHRYSGELLQTAQKWGVVETTPNHSIYGRDLRPFYPEEQREILALRQLPPLPTPMSELQLAIPGATASDFGAKSDSAWRLYLGADIVGATLEHYCGGSGAAHKHLPDFVFNLPREQQAHVLKELIATDGSRVRGSGIEALVSNEYRDHYFEFKTISPILAAQVGTLCSMLGYDYSVYTVKRKGRTDAYHIRYCSGPGERGDRLKGFTSFLHRRVVHDEWVYDIECLDNHNFVCGIGNIVCHNTNEPEYRKLQNNEYMEALRDRTVKIDIPYITRLSDEIKIYLKDFRQDKIVGKHIAPHVIEMAAMWAVLTRLEEPKHGGLTLVQKLKLYDGKTMRGFTEDNIRELKEEAEREGMEGISPRYIQDKISNALVNPARLNKDGHRDPRFPDGCVNPFMVLTELETGLKHHSLITSDEQRKRYRELLGIVKEEYEDIVKNEVQRAITADEEAIKKLCANYIDHVKAYTQREKVRNRFTGEDEEPDERLMRSIEEKIDIPESRKDDFRREVMNYIAALAIEGKTFDYTSNPRLQKALELKLFEDQKDTIKLTSLVSSVVDRETQEKIDVVKSRMINNYGYCEICATDVLNYVASIFARGDTKGSKR